MKEISKKLLSVLTAIAIIFTIFATPVGEIIGFVGEGVKASAYSTATLSTKKITDKNSSEVARALERISRQNGVSSCKQSGKSVRDMIEYFLFTSKYRVFGGEYFPKEYCNDASSSAKTITDGTYKESGIDARGCLAYAKWVARTINTIKKSGGTDSIAITNLTASTIKENIKKYAQAGETIQIARQSEAPHTIVFISADENGFYYFDFSGYSESYGKYNTRNFCYTTYEAFATGASKRGTGVWIAKYIDEQNNDDVLAEELDLSSAPNNLGTQFVAPIKVTSTGKVLTANADGNVTVADWKGTDNQRWIFTKNSSDNYYEIRNGQYYQKVLDVADAGNVNDANIQIWEDNDTSAQRFGVYGSQGSYVIKPKYSTTHVIDSDGGNSNVHLWQYYSSGIDAQKFTISPEPTTRFDTFSATSITTNDARVKCNAYKRSEDKAVKYGVVYAPADTWNNTSSRKTFYSTASTTNVGKTYREIYFDFGSEIGDTLKPDTTYNYYFVAVYNMDGVDMTFSSSVQSFKTSASCSTHSYGNWATKTAASCTSDGLKQRTCSKCGKIESATITKLGHSYTSSVTKVATCTATGIRTYTCSKCGDSYTATIAKTSHNYASSYTVDKAATCSAEGSKSRHCTTSGCTAKTDKTVIPKTSHSYTDTVVAPTYAEQGYTLHDCKNCDYSYKDNYVKKLTLSAITGFSNTAKTDKSLTLAWNKNTSADGYVIQMLYGTTWKSIKTVSGNATTSCTITGLAPSITYNFRICAYKTVSGATYYSAYTDKMSAITLPSAVANFRNTAKTDKSLTLAWDKNTTGDGYVIQMLYGTTWKTIKTVSGNATTSCTITGLAPSVTYNFRICTFKTAYGRNYYSAFSSKMSAITLPSAVTGFTNPVKTDKSLTLSWNKNTSGTGYVIQMLKNGTWTSIKYVSGNTVTSYTVTGLNPSTTYSFRVCAYNYAYNRYYYGAFSSSMSAITLPTSVTGLSNSAKSTNTLTLSWNKNTSATGYVIQMLKDNVWTSIRYIPDNITTSYKVTGLNPGTAYSFRVCAYNYAYNRYYYGAFTSALTKTTKPSDMQSFTLGGRAGNALRLNWNKNTSADGYIVEMYKDGKWVRIARIAGNATVTYRVEGLSPSTEYKFRMKAYKIDGSEALYSDYTSTLSAYTNPSAVSNLKITGKAGTALRLGWDKNTSADGYIIEQYKDGQWVRIKKITTPDTITYRVEGLAKGTTYKFRVRTYNMVGSTALYGSYVNVSGTTNK